MDRWYETDLAVLTHLLEQAAGGQLPVHQQGQVGSQAIPLEEARPDAWVTLLQGGKKT